MLEVAVIAGVGVESATTLQSRSVELAFLVRAKSVRIHPDLIPEAESWKQIEIDSTPVRIDIR